MGRYGKLKKPGEGMGLKIVGDRIKHGNYGGLMRCSREEVGLRSEGMGLKMHRIKDRKINYDGPLTHLGNGHAVDL